MMATREFTLSYSRDGREAWVKYECPCCGLENRAEISRETVARATDHTNCVDFDMIEHHVPDYCDDCAEAPMVRMPQFVRDSFAMILEEVYKQCRADPNLGDCAYYAATWLEQLERNET
jgi:hypothetical protein